MVSEKIIIHAPVTHVFDVFTRELGDWWPPDLTFSGADFQAAGSEHLQGGNWFEVNRSGIRTDWGEVLVWQPPERVILSWRVSVTRTQEPPDKASQVEFRFQVAEPDSTEVLVQHSNFARHGKAAEAMRAGMASDAGWRAILASLRDHAATH